MKQAAGLRPSSKQGANRLRLFLELSFGRCQAVLNRRIFLNETPPSTFILNRSRATITVGGDSADA